MSNATKIQPYASAPEVRAWALANGHKVGARGLFPEATITAYNRKHAVKYKAGKHVKTIEVKAKPAKGRTVTRKVNVEQVRKAAREAGVKVGARGNLPESVLTAFVLGTLGK
jgi:hypothetical protein